MKRIMTGNTIVLSLLIVGLIISIQGTTLAKAKKIEVKGIDDLEEVIWQETTPLGDSGRFLLEGLNKGGFNMTANDSAFNIVNGALILEYHINHDSTGNGTGHGPGKILDSNGSDATAWEGYWEGKMIYGMFEGEVVLQGRGRFDGMKLQFSFTEFTTLNYSFEGTILVPQGE